MQVDYLEMPSQICKSRSCIGKKSRLPQAVKVMQFDDDEGKMVQEFGGDMLYDFSLTALDVHLQ